MTDREFRRLGRAQLIEIIYRLQLQIDTLTEENKALEAALQDKRLRLEKVGNLAEASLELNDCFRSAQNAADQYLNEIKAMREETETERDRILAEAREILANAKKAVAGAPSPAEEEEIPSRPDRPNAG